MNKIIGGIRNYGLGATIMIAVKKVTEKVFRFSWQPMYLLSMETERFQVKESIQDNRIVRPTFNDFNQNWKESFLSQPKTIIFQERYNNKDTEIVGIIDDGELACVGWIYYGEVSVGGKFLLKKDPSVALLYDSFTLPTHRGRHLHRMLNEQRMLIAREHGCTRCYTVVYTHNKPSLNNCLKLGMKIEKRFCIYHFGNRYYCTLESSKLF